MNQRLVAAVLAVSVVVMGASVALAQTPAAQPATKLDRTVDLLRTILGPQTGVPQPQTQPQPQTPATTSTPSPVTTQVEPVKTKEQLEAENAELKRQIAVLRDIKTQELQRRIAELKFREGQINSNVSNLESEKTSIQRQIEYYVAELKAVNPEAAVPGETQPATLPPAAQ